MKKLALIIAIVLITIGTTNAKSSFDKAINSCKSLSTKDIKKSLCESKTFIELRDEQYVIVKDHVKLGLENTRYTRASLLNLSTMIFCVM